MKYLLLTILNTFFLTLPFGTPIEKKEAHNVLLDHDSKMKLILVQNISIEKLKSLVKYNPRTFQSNAMVLMCDSVHLLRSDCYKKNPCTEKETLIFKVDTLVHKVCKCVKLKKD